MPMFSPIAHKKTNTVDRAVSNVNPPQADHASRAETYVLREMPTAVHTLTLDTLCRKICQDIFLKASLMQGHQITYVPAWGDLSALDRRMRYRRIKI